MFNKISREALLQLSNHFAPKIRKTFALFVLGLLPLLVYSQSSGSDYTGKTIVLPIISASPETNLLFGGAAMFQFKMGDHTVDTRASTISLSGVYTLKNQLNFTFSPSLFLSGEKWVLNGDFSYSYFPESFWGLGPFSADNEEIKMYYREIFLRQSVLWEISPKFFVGPYFRWSKIYRMHYEDLDGNIIPGPQLAGANGFYATGLGIAVNWDERNSTTTPTKRHMLSLSVMTNPPQYSSLDSYTTFIFDGRKYFDIWGNGVSVLAFQVQSHFTAGDPPFQDMASLGGKSILRGYYEGRYVDRHGAQAQVELRQHIYWRLGIAGFAAVGQVWSSFNNIAWEESRFSIGGGIRYNINKKDPMNIRIDYGIGENSTGLYITVGEAF